MSVHPSNPSTINLEVWLLKEISRHLLKKRKRNQHTLTVKTLTETRESSQEGLSFSPLPLFISYSSIKFNWFPDRHAMVWLLTLYMYHLICVCNIGEFPSWILFAGLKIDIYIILFSMYAARFALQIPQLILVSKLVKWFEERPCFVVMLISIPILFAVFEDRTYILFCSPFMQIFCYINLNLSFS